MPPSFVHLSGHGIQAHAASGRLDLRRFYFDLSVLYRAHRFKNAHICANGSLFRKNHRIRRTIYACYGIARPIPFRYGDPQLEDLEK
jgi:hypothetical protein